MPTEPTSTARLAGVVVRSTDLEHDTAVYAAITGATPMRSAERVAFTIGDAVLILLSGDDGSTPRGIEQLVIEIADLDAADGELRSAGAGAKRTNDGVQIDRAWAGVDVELRPADQGQPAQPAGGELDHVAILAADIEMMSQRWTAIVGAPPADAGVHPLGTTIAARFLLGDRMIELLAPLPDTPSPLRSRLDQVGDGPFALAIIANDLDATMAAVTEAGARLLDQPPHIVVHPSDASGTPIQLTPRVNH